MLSSVARARTNVVNYVENRQAGQGRRVSNALSEGFEAPETAAQTGRRLTQARDEAANEEFGAVREDARPVDAMLRDEALQPELANNTIVTRGNAGHAPRIGLGGDRDEDPLGSFGCGRHFGFLDPVFSGSREASGSRTALRPPFGHRVPGPLQGARVQHLYAQRALTGASFLAIISALHRQVRLKIPAPFRRKALGQLVRRRLSLPTSPAALKAWTAPREVERRPTSK